MSLPPPLAVMPGVRLWPGALDALAQAALVDDIHRGLAMAPLYRPLMPRSGKPFSVEQSNFGSLGWVSDRAGYRYQPQHPHTGAAWPPIPPALLALWAALCPGEPAPQCCLINLYRAGARMGLHQDRDEQALAVAVLSISLGDDALFRIGGPCRRGPTKSLRLRSGDVLCFGGPARLAFHGIDRIVSGTSAMVPGGGRFNLTLRRVTPA